MPSGFSYCPQMGNEVYQSPPSKDFTCSSLTSRDYVPLSGDLTPVYQDSMPVHRDIMPVYQNYAPVYQDSMPVYQESTLVYQDIMPVCQDFVPASQDLPIVKDVCTTSDSVSEVDKPFIPEGLVSLLHNKVNSRKIEILQDTDASESLLLADILPFSEKSYPGESVLLQGGECGIVNVPLHVFSYIRFNFWACNCRCSFFFTH